MNTLKTDNFNYENINSSLEGWSREELVRLAIFSSELVIDLYSGDSDAPTEAIQAAKNWIRNPTSDAVEAADDAANHADYVSSKSVCNLDVVAVTTAYYAAAAAKAATKSAAVARATSAARTAAQIDGVEQKISCYINSKNNELLADDLDWNGEGIPATGCNVNIRSKFNSKQEVYQGIVLYASDVHCILDVSGHECNFRMSEFTYEKPETLEQKKESEELEAAYDLYLCWSCEGHIVMPIGRFKDTSLYENFLRVVRKIGYRKPE